MRRLLLLGATAWLLAGTLSGTAWAQADDELCATRVQKACGEEHSVVKCFEDQTKWADVGAACEGAVQTLIENENDANQAEGKQPSAVGYSGFSYGGILRGGPSMDAAKLASIRKGDRVDVLEDSGISMDGYKWYKVRTPRGIGYHWGGIFCISGDTLPEGVFDNCQMMNQ